MVPSSVPKSIGGNVTQDVPLRDGKRSPSSALPLDGDELDAAPEAEDHPELELRGRLHPRGPPEHEPTVQVHRGQLHLLQREPLADARAGPDAERDVGASVAPPLFLARRVEPLRPERAGVWEADRVTRQGARRHPQPRAL
jgi:hypothetical protein